MTIQAWWLLRKLKKAQVCLDGYVGIDPETMKAITIHTADQTPNIISLKRYAKSLDATLDYLQEQGCIRCDDQYNVQVTYTGWYILSATIFGTTKTIILNVVIPIIVSVVAAVITTIALSR